MVDPAASAGGEHGAAGDGGVNGVEIELPHVVSS